VLLVLAIEPDPRQAATLKRVVKGQVRADLIVVDSKDAALATIATRIPDLILVTALLPPRDEDDLTQHLKTLDRATHLQTVTIPLLASAPAQEKLGSRVFGAFRRKRRATAIDGCDPRVFGEQIEVYLQRAAELRAEKRAHPIAAQERTLVSSPADSDRGAEVVEQGSSRGGAGEIAGLHVAAMAREPVVERAFGPADASLIAEQDVAPARVEEVVEQPVPVIAREPVVERAFGPADASLIAEQDSAPARVEQVVEQPVPVIAREPVVERAFGPADASLIAEQDSAPARVEQVVEQADEFVEYDLTAAVAALAGEDSSLVINGDLCEYAVEADATEQHLEAIAQQSLEPIAAQHVEAVVERDFRPEVVAVESAAEQDFSRADLAAIAAQAEERTEPEALEQTLEGIADSVILTPSEPEVHPAGEVPAALEIAPEHEADAFVQPALALSEQIDEPLKAAVAVCEEISMPRAASASALPVTDERRGISGDVTPACPADAREDTHPASEPLSPGTGAADGDRLPPFLRETPAAVHAALIRALAPFHAFVAHIATDLKSAGSTVATGLKTGGPICDRDRVEPPGGRDPRRASPGVPNAATALGRSGVGVPFDPGASRPDAVIESATPITVVASAEQTAAAVAVAMAEDSASGEEDWQDLTPLIAPAAESPAEDSVADSREGDGQATEVPAATGLKTGGPTGEGDSNARPEIGDEAKAEKKTGRRRRRPRARRPVPELETPMAGLDGHWIASAIAALRVDIERLRQETLTAGTSRASATREASEASRARAGSGTSGASADGNGPSHAHQPSAQEPEPVQDEWGFYDPGRCGMRALMARLEAQDAADQDQAAGRSKASAMQKLIASHADASRPRRPTARTENADEKRLAPLAMWARADEGTEYDIEQILPGEPLAHLPGLMAGLRLPEHVAAVRYASGCRIRRVRVAPGPEKPRGDKRQVVIVSKKALRELR
jgi:CheY-like chemotaxis protein